MLTSFPAELLPLLRCVDDGAPLALDGLASPRCTRCGRTYVFDGPVLRMGLNCLHPESDHEKEIRDAEASTDPNPSWDTPADTMEIDATLAALDLRPQHRLLELGAGRGRFTTLAERACREVVALDISAESLRDAARRLTSATVALVQGDATKAIVAPGTFDRVLGTLTSNLPDRSTREGSYRTAADALTSNGKFVFSTHYFGARAHIDREPREGRYTEGGIYRRFLTRAEVLEETAPYFQRVQVRPICVILPFSRRVGLPVIATDRIARRVPLLRALGSLLLAVASGPRR